MSVFSELGAWMFTFARLAVIERPPGGLRSSSCARSEPMGSKTRLAAPGESIAVSAETAPLGSGLVVPCSPDIHWTSTAPSPTSLPTRPMAATPSGAPRSRRDDRLDEPPERGADLRQAVACLARSRNPNPGSSDHRQRRGGMQRRGDRRPGHLAAYETAAFISPASVW